MNAFKAVPIYTQTYAKPYEWYDRIAFTRLAKHGTILCDWDIDVEHLRTERFLDAPPAAITEDIPVAL
jgi:hypothetical protein